MSTVRELALDLAVVKAMADTIKGVEADLKANALQLLDPGDRKHATVDGVDCGTVSVSSPTSRWSVVDDAAFTAWVGKNHPTAMVQVVRDSDRKAILDGIAVSGEVPDGVSERSGASYVSVRLTTAQREALVAAYRSGRVAIPELGPAPDVS